MRPKQQPIQHLRLAVSHAGRLPCTLGLNSRTYKVRRGQDEIVPLPEGVAPPLVSAALWDDAQRRLATNRARSRRRAADPDSALLRGGLARCALCGYPMMTDNRGGPPQVPRYRCRHGLRTRGLGCQAHTILVAALDAVVWARCPRSSAIQP